MSTPTAITLAIEILREDMRALVDCHAHPETGVIPPDEPEARAAYERYCAAINGLEALAQVATVEKASQPVATDKDSLTVAQPVAWRYTPSDAWRDCVLTDDPAKAALAREHGREVQPLYTAATAPAGLVPLTPSQKQFIGLLERIEDLEGVLRMVDDNRRVDDGEEGAKAWRGDFVDTEVRRVLGGIKAGKDGAV